MKVNETKENLFALVVIIIALLIELAVIFTFIGLVLFLLRIG